VKAGFLNPAFGATWCTKHEEVSFEEEFEDGPIWVFEREEINDLNPSTNSGGRIHVGF